MNEEQTKQQKADELVQVVMGVALIAFAMIAVAVLLAMQVSAVLHR
ncbi:MAG: hypothetical protein ABJB39_10840 [Chloroflexota bacterium]